MENNTIETKYNKLIIVLSVVIPVAVAALFGVSFKKLGIDVEPFTFLPPIYASINALTALLLVVAVIAIKNGNRKLHEILMKLAIACSVAFLLMYVAYHMSSESTKYLGEYKMVYYFILISHILLSIAIIP
jgi:putative membrane protein